jgi:hypothetical protein
MSGTTGEEIEDIVEGNMEGKVGANVVGNTSRNNNLIAFPGCVRVSYVSDMRMKARLHTLIIWDPTVQRYPRWIENAID